jgi:hypothetical protein
MFEAEVPANKQRDQLPVLYLHDLPLANLQRRDALDGIAATLKVFIHHTFNVVFTQLLLLRQDALSIELCCTA